MLTWKILKNKIKYQEKYKIQRKIKEIKIKTLKFKNIFYWQKHDTITLR